MGIFNFLKKKDGLVKSWYPNGQLEYEFNYKDGKIDGLSNWWYDNGQLETILHYKDDELDRIDYENGQRTD